MEVGHHVNAVFYPCTERQHTVQYMSFIYQDQVNITEAVERPICYMHAAILHASCDANFF